jgi:basic membrane lipoprotein Med (substrate-binding protein (PBP1-ABC) superfamily)/DNA-binding SARP family transcriptional activator
VEFEILGPLRVLDGAEEVDLGSRKQRTLLALLVVNANRVVTTERIIDELWPGDPDGHENALWVYISRLRGILEPERSGRGGHEVLQTRDHGYVLNVSAGSVDASRFEEQVSEAGRLAREDAEAAAELLRGAEAEWRGRPLEGLDADFATVEAARLDELRISALEDRFDLDLRQGVVGHLASEIEAVTQEHPYRERLVGQLMLALYRSGRQADALRTFERFRRTIGEDLGIDPSPELVRLEEQILLHDNRLQPRRTRTTRTSAAPTGGAVDAENPFKGLRAFGEEDADDFFGRDRLVGDVVRRVAEGDSLLALVGPSGSGKSSALRAGVIPALRKGAVDGSDRWLTAQMVPGARPFAELEAALLRSTLDGPDSLADQLRGEDGLLGAALRVLPDDTSRLLVVIDQFEELFTLVDDERVRSDFLDALIPALDDPHGRVSVLLTLRADFYARPLSHPDFGRRMGDGVVNVVPLTTDELEAAAVEPMLRAGCHFEPSLLVALLGDVAGQPGALPVFQYTLTELYERRTGDMLTMASYEQIGGVRGALAQRAEDLFGGLSEDEHDVARQLFLRLVTIGDGDEWGRRRVAAREILGLDVDVVALQRVIQEFGDRRLLSFDRDHVTGSPTVEVAHEALLTEWPRLHDWIAEARADVRRRASLGAAAVEWDAADRNTDYLFAGSRLDEYEAWVGTSALALTELERDFLGEAVVRREAESEADAERVAREHALDRRARIRAWGLAAAVALIAAAGAWLILFTEGDDPGPRVARVEPLQAAGGLIGLQFDDGWAQAERQFDLQFDAPLDPVSDRLGQLVALIETEPDLIVLDGLAGDFLFGPGSELETIFTEHPDQLFALSDETFDSYPNLVTFEYAPNEGSFLAGLAAALTSETGVIGFVGGVPLYIDDFRAGFEAGARYGRPDIQVLNTYLVGDPLSVFSVGSRAVEVTNDLIDRGADVIYHAAGDSGDVILRAIADRQDRHVWFIGVDVDQSLTAPPEHRDHVLTSMLKRHDLALVEILRRLDAGELEPGAIEGNVANGVMGLVTPGNLTEEVVAAVDEAQQHMSEGTIAVPWLPDRPPIEAIGTDYSIGVEITDSGCTVGDLAPMTGDFVRFDIDNRKSEEAGVAAWKLVEGTAVESITIEGLLSGEQSEEQSPRTATDVAGGSAAALTVQFDDPGDWLISCYEAGSDTVRGAGVRVVEPAATGEVRVTVEGADTSALCTADLDGLVEGDAIAFELENRTEQPMGLLVAKVADGTTSLDRGWVFGSGAVLVRRIGTGPGETASGVVVLDEPGTFAANCFVFQPPFDDLNTIVFDVAP